MCIVHSIPFAIRVKRREGGKGCGGGRGVLYYQGIGNIICHPFWENLLYRLGQN